MGRCLCSTAIHRRIKSRAIPGLQAFFLYFLLVHILFLQTALATPVVQSPSATVNSIPVHQPTPVVVQALILTSAGDPALIAGSVNLLRLDAAGKSAVLGVMRDDGLNGDQAAGDNIFSLQVSFNEKAAGTVRLQASAAFKGQLKRVTSAVTEIPVVAADPRTTDDDKDGFSENLGDCDDTQAAVYPNAPEVCNNRDDNCNNQIDDSAGQTLTCGVGACERTVSSCGNGQSRECIPGSPAAEI